VLEVEVDEVVEPLVLTKSMNEMKLLETLGWRTGFSG
jgi:hypothetical protein